MLVLASAPSGADSHFLGIELQTGKARWTNPREDQRGLRKVRAMQFERKPPWCIAALEDGNVIRFNALTGREQRRFVAEWRTPDQQQDRKFRRPEMSKATISVDGRTVVSSHMEWIYVWDVESGKLPISISISIVRAYSTHTPTVLYLDLPSYPASFPPAND